jgi:protoporphyrinogen IX oxidase
MDAAYVIGLILFIIHLIALVAGGANAVVMPVMGPRLASATGEVRGGLMGVVMGLSKIGKWALGTLLVSGVLVLWLKWNWVPPNPGWFWAKMAFVALMIVFIALNEVNARKARAGDAEAGKMAARFGQFTALAFLGVIITAVFAFN